MKASAALIVLLALDLAAIAMVLGLAWQRSGRFDHLDTAMLLVFLVLPALLLGGFAKGMDDHRPIVFFAVFFGLILLPWLAAYAALGPGMLRSSAEAAASGSAFQEYLDRAGPWPVLGGVLLYTLFVAWVFLRMAGWASVLPPPEGATPLPAATLRDRLLAVAKADVPFSVRAGEEPGSLVAEWRYADARWFDLARAHAMHKAIRYVMRLDEESRSVRVLEYRAEFSASAGAGGAGLRYSMSRGVTFFETQSETVLGVQVKNGALAPELSYRWRFDVEEIRGPLAKIVNEAGWAWKPLMLDVKWLAG